MKHSPDYEPTANRWLGAVFWTLFFAPAPAQIFDDITSARVSHYADIEQILAAGVFFLLFALIPLLLWAAVLRLFKASSLLVCVVYPSAILVTLFMFGDGSISIFELLREVIRIVPVLLMFWVIIWWPSPKRTFSRVLNKLRS